MADEGDVVRCKKIVVELVKEGELRVVATPFEGDEAVYTASKDLNDEFDTLLRDLKRHQARGWEVLLHVLEGMLWGVAAYLTEVSGDLLSIADEVVDKEKHFVTIDDNDKIWVVPSMKGDLSKLIDKKLTVEITSTMQIIGWEEAK